MHGDDHQTKNNEIFTVIRGKLRKTEPNSRDKRVPLNTEYNNSNTKRKKLKTIGKTQCAQNKKTHIPIPFTIEFSAMRWWRGEAVRRINFR